jgi:uncharacterized membrane protein YphA (DoxX/SURF4 family)|tara:strand:- start:305 stop:736 length:432 start_codon:yes stop_codon:yes gene_type:complete
MIKIHPMFILFTRIVLGIIFIVASIDKIIDPASFARDIANYHVVPYGLENMIAIFLPWLELFIGLSLIFGFMVDGASLISGVLLILFILIIFQATMRGFNIECGCGLKEGDLVGWRKIFEDIVFLLGAYLVYKRKTKLYEIKI